MARIATKAGRAATSGLASFTVPLWLLAAGGSVFFLRAFHADAHEIYASLEFAPPTLLAVALGAGEWLQTPTGLGIALGTIALSAVPGFVWRRGKRVALIYALLAIAVTAVCALVYDANTNALVMLNEQLAVPGGR